MERLVGDMCGGGTPGPISNPAVKPASADGSMRATACESRSLPTSSFLTCLFYWSSWYENYVSQILCFTLWDVVLGSVSDSRNASWVAKRGAVVL